MTEAQIKDIIQEAVGFDKVKIPQPAASEYSTPSGTSIASSSFYDNGGAGTTTQWETTSPNAASLGDIGASGAIRIAQRITDTTKRNLGIISVGIALRKLGTPTGILTCKIRKTSDDSIVATANNTLDVSTLSTAFADIIFNFNRQQLPNEDFRICFEYSGGNSTNYIQVGEVGSNAAYAGGVRSRYVAAWADSASSGTLAEDLDGFMTLTDPFQPYDAKDGNTATFWKSNNELNPYYIIDTGALKLISGIRIYWNASGRPTGFDIDYSEDGVTYYPTSRQNVPQGTAGQYNEYAFNTVYARYIRVQANETIAMEIAEIQYFERTSDRILARHGHGSVS